MNETRTTTSTRSCAPQGLMTVVPPTVPLSPFTPTEWRVVQYLVRGLTPAEIAVKLGRSISMTRRHLRFLRYKTHCPTRCPLPVLVHRLLTSHGATAPATDLPVPELDTGEVKLLLALAEEVTRFGRATVAGLRLPDLAPAVNALLGKTGAANTTQLVGLAHSWKLLPNRQDHVGRNGASQ
ncbi:helix-turn-helix transcriptional regulator [Streptomyces ardesiacus]